MPRTLEEELIHRCQRGEREAFQALVRMHAERAYRASFALLGNREDAEDTTQEAFLKAFQHIRSFKGRASFYTWFYRILSRTSYERVRAKGRRALRDALSLTSSFAEEGNPASQQLADQLEAPGEDVRERLIQEEEFEILREAFRELPQEDYELLSTRALARFSYEQIAQLFGWPAGTVMSRLYRARLRLRETMDRIRKRGGQTPGSDPFINWE